MEEIEQLSGLHQLETVYLHGNPLANNTQYRTKVILTIPSLTQLDSSMVAKQKQMLLGGT